MRNKGDEEADQIVGTTVKQNELPKLYAALALPDEKLFDKSVIPLLRNFLLKKRPDPSWFKIDRIENGQAFFRKYALDIMTLLGAKSLPYCYAATPGNKAIHFTQKMRQSPGKRLMETAQFITAVFEAGAFGERSSGYIQINKIRLVHALVRYYILAKSQWQNEWGLPVNQEDMAGTNLAFSYIILMGLEDSKYKLEEHEKEDFLFVWRYIGYQMHIDDDLLPASVAEAKLLEETIKERHFKPSDEGVILTKELVQHYKEAFPLIPSYFIDAQIRYYLGPQVSTLVGLKPQVYKDSFVKFLNKLKEKVNTFYVDKKSYEKMLRNHLILKKKYL
jgi:hypothetical protein